MSRVNLVDPAVATAANAQTFAQIERAMGGVPNMFRAVANSPAALQSMWGSFAALGGGTLGAQIGEQIAVAIADRNRCEYCLAAHTLLGTNAGLSAETLASAQTGQATDPRTAAILTLATALVEQRGQVSAAEVDAARNAGLTDEEIVEVVAHVALNVFTNYINVALAVPVDFAPVPLTT